MSKGHVVVSLSPTVSLKSVASAVSQQLNDVGYALITQTELPTQDVDLEKQLTATLVVMGEIFELGRRVAYFTLRGKGSDDFLEHHTESIYAQAGITPYFALGCVQPAEEGGETSVYDGRQAASRLETGFPEIARAEIEYTSLAYPKERSIHKVCTDGVVRFRAGTVSDKIVNLPVGYTSETFYKTVESVLDSCLVLEHRWQRGDILLVNNMITLHSRAPYKGLRTMVRVRYDEPLNVSLSY